MKIILNTGAYVGFKLNAVEIVDCIACADLVLFSPIVLGELMFGFRNGNRFKENMDDLNSFLQHEVVELTVIGNLTSNRYSRIAKHLKRKGAPIPTNDIWIAAQTMEHGAELITTDQHFEKINGLVYTRFTL